MKTDRETQRFRRPKAAEKNVDVPSVAGSASASKPVFPPVGRRKWLDVACELEHLLGAPPNTLSMERRVNYEAQRVEIGVFVTGAIAQNLASAPTSLGGYEIVYLAGNSKPRVEAGLAR